MNPKQLIGFGALKTEQFILKGDCLLHEEIQDDNFFITYSPSKELVTLPSEWVFYSSFKGKTQRKGEK